MAFPLALALPAITGFLTKSKWLLVVGALAFSHYFAYTKGSESVYKDQLKEVSGQVRAEREVGRKAVEQATKDTASLVREETKGSEQLQRFDQIVDRTPCAFSSDELRILEEIARGTGTAIPD